MTVTKAESTRVNDIIATMRAAASGGAGVISIISVTETGSVEADGPLTEQRQPAARWKMLLQSW